MGNEIAKISNWINNIGNMLAHSLVFIFSFITIASSLAVISAKNTIHAVSF